MGYSQNACERETGVSNQSINYWLNGASFAEQFRAEVKARAALFMENLTAVEDQLIVQATQIVGRAINGDANAKRSVQLDVALELLRNTRWKQKVGEQHKQFGA